MIFLSLQFLQGNIKKKHIKHIQNDRAMKIKSNQIHHSLFTKRLPFFRYLLTQFLINQFHCVSFTDYIDHMNLRLQNQSELIFEFKCINKRSVNKQMKRQAQLANDLKKLQYQLSYSEHINRQLSEQLSIMCEKSGLSIKKLKAAQNIPEINYTKMLQQLYYVEPLFMAYQHKISLFQQELKQMQQESQNLEKYAEQIVKENDFLRKELQRKAEYILKSEQVGININFIKLDNDSLTEKNKILNQKNDFLLQKIKTLSKTVDSLKKGQNNELTINKLQKDIQKETDSRKQLQLQCLDMKGKLQIVSNQCNNQKAMNKELQRKLSQLQNQLSKYKNEAKILRQQLESNLNNNQHIKENLEAELQTIKSQLLISQRKESELFNKAMVLESDLNQKNSKLHNLTLQNTQLQTNNNNILQMLENYQAKVNSLNKKIKSLEQQTKESSDSFTQNRKELEIAQWKLSQKTKEIQRRDIEFKKEKERISKMWEERLQVMRNAFEQEKDRIYDQIKGKSAISRN